MNISTNDLNDLGHCHFQDGCLFSPLCLQEPTGKLTWGSDKHNLYRVKAPLTGIKPDCYSCYSEI